VKTSYFARAFRLPRADFFIVRISIGSPRGGQCDAFLPSLAPTREMLEEGYGADEYFAQLQGVGLENIGKQLAAVEKAAKGRKVLLCCFESLAPEKVAEGQWCHRRLFAEWWEHKTGAIISEYQP
jgi:hypothetical protein